MSAKKAKPILITLEEEVLEALDRAKFKLHRGSRSLLINAILKGTLDRIYKQMDEKRIIPLDGCKAKL
jgi:metal-responsive CopG/Arc/MetJ family transcriptional regulator